MKGLFIGLTTLDVIHQVEQLPGQNQKVKSQRFVMAAGGPVTNGAVSFSAYGGHATLVTRLPDHPLSHAVIEDLHGCGIKLFRSPDSGSAPPVVATTTVQASNGDRATVSFVDGGFSNRLQGAFSPVANTDNATPWKAPVNVSNVDVALIDGYHRDLFWALLPELRQNQVPIILDGGSWKPYMKDLLPHVDVAIVSNDFRPPELAADADADALLEYLLSTGVKLAIITNGDKPIIYRGLGKSRELQKTVILAGKYSPQRVAVVDTLGAGDFFHGAFAPWVAATHGLPRTHLGVHSAIGFASHVAGLSISEFGPRAWLKKV